MDRIEASNAAYVMHCEACELRGGGKNEEAAARWASCVALSPDEPVYLREYADCLARLQRWEEDLHYASLASSLEPSCAEAWALMGAACGYLGRQEEARRCYDRADRLAPNSPSVLWNRSLHYLLHGRYAEGWRDYEWRFLTSQRRRTLKAPWDGRRAEPFAVHGMNSVATVGDCPPDIGTANAVDGRDAHPTIGFDRTERVLLVWSEQGLGDTLQFVRFLKLAKERWGGRVVFEPQRELVTLFHGHIAPPQHRPPGRELHAIGADEVMSPPVGGSVPFDDFEHVALMSLPMVLGIDREEDFWTGPYLKAGPGTGPIPLPLPIGMERGGLVEAAVSSPPDGRDALGEDHPESRALAHSTQPVLDGMPVHGYGHGTRIGVCWQGARSNGCDSARSIGRDEFWDAIVGPCLNSDGAVTFYSVNPDVRLPDCEGCVNPELSSFVDTARVIAGLDLVITVDTSVAHLAGAMGKPVWILLRYATDWRWCLNHESTSPWYPSARLFRQKAYGVGWAEVLRRVRSALGEFGIYPGSADAQD